MILGSQYGAKQNFLTVNTYTGIHPSPFSINYYYMSNEEH